MTHDDLIQRGAKWLKNNPTSALRMPIILTEFHSYASEIPDVIGFSHYKSIVIECKISLQDFKSDLKKPHRQLLNKLGKLRYYLCPENIIPIDLVPEEWGLLYCTENRIKIVKEATWQNGLEIRNEEYYILYSIVRRAYLKGYLPELERIPKEVLHHG